jgi:hypothetical protein
LRILCFFVLDYDGIRNAHRALLSFKKAKNNGGCTPLDLAEDEEIKAILCEAGK